MLLPGLSYHVVSSFLEDSAGNFWISTEGGGLNYFDKANGKFNSYLHDEHNLKSLSDNNIQDITADKNGRLYIATHGGGQNVMNPSERPGVFDRFRYDPTDSLSNRTDYIPTIFCDSKNRIWVGFAEEGLSQFIPETGQFVPYEKSRQGLNTVWNIFEDHRNRNFDKRQFRFVAGRSLKHDNSTSLAWKN